MPRRRTDNRGVPPGGGTPASGSHGIDQLFQVPPEQFTAARNALAKETGSAGIRALAKPPLAAWAVNQLYWKHRATYEALVDSAEAVRRAHKAVLTGRGGDIRAAGATHDAALDAAVKQTLALLSESGHAASDATRQAIVNTLRSLPSVEAPGRLTRTLQPGGFELLSGIAPRAAGPAQRKPERVPAPSGPPKTIHKRDREESGATARELAQAKEKVSATTRELREAEQAARRDEFESARAARESARAATRLEEARQALAAAEGEVEEAERARKTADKHRQDAERRAKAAADTVAAARERAAAAHSALQSIKSPSSRDR